MFRLKRETSSTHIIRDRVGILSGVVKALIFENVDFFSLLATSSNPSFGLFILFNELVRLVSIIIA